MPRTCNEIPCQKRGSFVRLPLLVTVCLAGWAPPLQAQPEEILRDLSLDHGFNLSAVRSSMRPNELGPVMANRPDPKPQWRLAQWGTRFGLTMASPVTRRGVARVVDNEGKTIRVHRRVLAGEGVTLTVKGAAEYGGKLRQKGEAWPHLLIEQQLPKPFMLSGRERLRLRIEFRIDRCQNTTGKTLTRNLHTAQITAFFAIHNRNKGSADYNDMIWFGIPLFDARVPVPRGHQAVDGGKDDATGKFICTLPGPRFWGRPTGDGAWHKLDEDLIPLIQ
ncbi:MAG: hypothetical protein ACYTGQ_17140, partial [Planctomycetota bacterium]